MKRTRLGLLIIFIISLTFILDGCASFRKKFIRKKKSDTVEEVIVSPKEYPQTPNDVSYYNHYTYFKYWMQELVERIDGGNDKKIKQCYNSALYEADEMLRFLKEEKKQELEKILGELRGLKTKIEAGGLTNAEERRLGSRIDSILIKVDSDFRLSKVVEWIKQ